MRRYATLKTALCSGLLLASCTNGKTPGAGEGAAFTDPFDKDPVVEDSKCDAVNRTKFLPGNGVDLGHLNDPFAQLLHKSDNCPTTQAEILAELKDTELCNMDSLRTMIVTEEAQILDEDVTTHGFRSVTALDCGENGETGIMFSSFPTAGGPSMGIGAGFLEVIARDETNGVFNYYEGGTNKPIVYFGHSQAFVEDPGPGFGGRARCAGCHTGGGLIMKELAAPWLHWEGDTTTPGARDFIEREENKELFGDHDTGIEMESITRAGNRFWNETRVDFLKDNTKSIPKAFNSILAGNAELNATQKLLEPLFCVTEINVDTSSSSGRTNKDGDDQTGAASFGPLGGPIFPSQLGFGSINFSGEDYDNVIDAEGYGVFKSNGQKLSRDTHFNLPFVTPSAADQDYIQKLQSEGIIDREFMEDVLAVDFTRAISTDRCALLRLVPDLPTEQRTAGEITGAVLDSLKDLDAQPVFATFSADQKKAAVELRNNLLNSDDNARDLTNTFRDACQERTNEVASLAQQIRDIGTGTARANQVKEITELLVKNEKIDQVTADKLVAEASDDDTSNDLTAESAIAQFVNANGIISDYMKAIEAGRDQARLRQVFENIDMMQSQPGTVPFSTRLHPTTCTITNEFVPQAVEIDRATSCAGRCSINDEDAECQCDEGCQERGDCCEGAQGFEAVCVVQECDPDICEVDEKAKPADKGCVSPKFEANLVNGQNCVQKVCAADSFCCESNFDSACVNQVNEVCGFECPNVDPPIQPGPPIQPLPVPEPGVPVPDIQPLPPIFQPQPGQPRVLRIEPTCTAICKKSKPCGAGCISSTKTCKKTAKETTACSMAEDGTLSHPLVTDADEIAAAGRTN